MATISNSSFASRLGHARTLHTLLVSYGDYTPPLPHVSPAVLLTAIEQIESKQSDFNAVQSIYTTKTDERKKLFSDSNDSIAKRLSPIRAFVEAIYGRNSIELKQINTSIKKIRGVTTSKTKSKDDGDIKHISTIERTYASQLSDFKTIIDVLKTFGETYSPPNALISVSGLEDLATAASEVTNGVETALANLKPLINSRKNEFDALHEQTQSIKNFVKAQYGLNSKEYTQIKGLYI